MEIFWLCVVAVMLTVYVILDGFDLGVGVLHLVAARHDDERRKALHSIGPLWDGNEVWLLAAGGTLYFSFPILYASSFSGFYLPLMIVLWLLILRGVSIELRNHFQSPVWRPFWDVAFFGSSSLLAIFYGVALGNVVRGVPLEQSRYFFLPLWTDFGFREGSLGSAEVGVIDWYTLLVGLLAFFTLTIHGARWIVLKTDGSIQKRALSLTVPLWWLVVLLTMTVTAATFWIQPQVLSNFAAYPWGFVFPVTSIAGLLGMYLSSTPSEALRAFLFSSLYIVGMLTSAAFGIFPFVLPSNSDPALGLTIYNAAAQDYGLRVGLGWFIPGIALAIFYFIFMYRQFAGKVQLEEESY